MTAQKPRRQQGEPAPGRAAHLPDKRHALDRFQLLIHCRDETEQRRLYEMLVAKGLTCRVLVS